MDVFTSSNPIAVTDFSRESEITATAQNPFGLWFVKFFVNWFISRFLWVGWLVVGLVVLVGGWCLVLFFGLLAAWNP